MADLDLPNRREEPVVDRLRRHRAVIERMTASLEERETLPGEEIDALLSPGFMAQPATWDLALAGREILAQG